MLWLLSAITGAVAASAGQWASAGASSSHSGEPDAGGEIVLLGFWVVLVVLVWGRRATAAVQMIARRADLARAFLLLLGPFAALANDTAAVLMTHDEAGVATVAALDVVLVGAATVAMYRPTVNAFLATRLAERAAALHAYTHSPTAAPRSGT